MKHCIPRLTNSLWALSVSIFLLASCVSAPKGAAAVSDAPVTDAPATIPETATAKPATPEIPAVMDFHLPLPAFKKPAIVLDLPRLTIEKPADITLLSPVTAPVPLVSRIPDPAPPVIAQPPKPAAPAAVPVPPAKPLPVKEPPKPVPKPAPKPAAAVPAAPGPTAAALPPAPPSAARVEQPAAIQKPQIEVEAIRTQRFDLRFTGTGWTYLGDEQGNDGIRYETRRFEKNEAVFTLNPDRVGEYLLQFRRQDPVEQKAESVFVRVVVSALPGVIPAAGTVSQAVQPEIVKAANPPVATPSPVPTSPPSPATAPVPAAVPPISAAADYTLITDPELLLKYAREQLSAGKVQPCLDALNRYVSLFSSGGDELYYLYALAYEQNTPFRNIKKSYENYKRVRDEYPRSKLRKDVLERIAYLEKHYYGLR